MTVRNLKGTKKELLPARKVQGVVQKTNEWKRATALMAEGQEVSVKIAPDFCGLVTPVAAFRNALTRWAKFNLKKIHKYDVYVVDGVVYAVREDKY